jgi:hypothetical protein
MKDKNSEAIITMLFIIMDTLVVVGAGLLETRSISFIILIIMYIMFIISYIDSKKY